MSIDRSIDREVDSLGAKQQRRGPAFDPGRDDDTVLESVAQRHGFLDDIRRRPVLGWMYRLAVAVVGASVVVIGLILVPAPGPGWLIVFGGLAILASEFSWAKRLLDYGRAKFRTWAQWAKSRPPWLRGLIGLAGVVFLLCLLLGSLYLSGWRGFPFTVV